MKQLTYILFLFLSFQATGQTLVNPYIAKRVTSAPPAPTIPSFITNAYDASEASSITHASNVVSQWNDIIGSNNLTQGTAANRPLWNGTDAILFSWSTASGSDDYMNGLIPGSYSLPVTFYLILNSNSTGTGGTILRNIGAGQALLFHNLGGNTMRGFLGNGGDVAYTNNTQVCVKVVYNGASSSIQINNGTPVTFGTAVTSITDATVGWQGAGPGVTFNAIYRANLVPNGTQDSEIKAYITSKWGITF